MLGLIGRRANGEGRREGARELSLSPFAIRPMSVAGILALYLTTIPIVIHRPRVPDLP